MTPLSRLSGSEIARALRARSDTVDGALANALPHIVWTCDATGQLEWINDRWFELTGMGEDGPLASETTIGFVHPDDHAEIARRWRHARETSSPAEFEYRIRSRSGEYRWHIARITPIMAASGHVARWVAAAFDVSDRRAAEDALRRADRRKDDFLALLSHELRNPLMPILTAAHLLEVRADQESRRDIEVIVRQVKHLVRLVDDLLDVSRVARGSVTLARTRLELSCVVERAVEATWPLFDERGHQLEMSVPAEGLAIEGDEVRLTQVVDNLLTNAARYTPPGGAVTVSGTREGDSVVLRVRDTGIGIDPTLVPDLFGMFVQGLRGPDRAPGGLGIGLSLVRLLTELHGGTVTAQSEGLGRGSEFIVRLPRAANATDLPAHQNAARSAATSSAEGRQRVLVVDDHRDVLNGLTRVLAITGFDVRAALTPTEALALADEFRPQIAILDIGLPEMDGYTLARELRSRLREAPPIMIALSGYIQEEDKQRSETSGFALHLVKPIDVDTLVEALDKLAVVH